MKIEIIWSSDSYDCEDCGGSWASGAVVSFNDAVVIDEPALAHCYGGSSMEPEAVYKKILELLGHELVEQYA